jgi:hypothetical protein
MAMSQMNFDSVDNYRACCKCKEKIFTGISYREVFKSREQLFGYIGKEALSRFESQHSDHEAEVKYFSEGDEKFKEEMKYSTVEAIEV